jgi:hypothetical protein
MARMKATGKSVKAARQWGHVEKELVYFNIYD